jgi:hypothetical protein
MKAPFHPRIKDPKMAFTCNEDPNLLDAMYVKLLGRGGENALSDEVKWLAVTHKSFDQGRRGFNDKLAFFGMLSSTIYSGGSLEFGKWVLMMNYRKAYSCPPRHKSPPQLSGTASFIHR